MKNLIWTCTFSLLCLCMGPVMVQANIISQNVSRIPSTNTSPSKSNACAIHIAKAEKAEGIPLNLMQAIAKVESGRRHDDGNLNAWPWSVNVEGKSYYYQSKAEAIKAVKQFQNEGKSSIDVGCMQVNLHHHPDAFASLHTAFDPQHNVQYAAKHLKALYRETKDWHKAVSYYHSKNPTHHIPYHGRVMAMWDKKAIPRIRKMKPVIRVASKSSKSKSIKPQKFKVVPTAKGSVLVASNTSRVKRVNSAKGVRIYPTSHKGGAVKRVESKK